MKIAIVGAGIIGLYLAWKLSDKGHQVTVFEKRGKIGKEVCSGLFSERILEFIPESRKLIQNQIDYTLIHFPKKTIKVEFAKRFFVMRHDELDRLTANLAQSSGAEIQLNHETGSDPVSFERVIGCDGALSETRRRLKLKDPKFRLGMQCFVEEHNYSNYVETWPIKGGFRWKIPRGGNTEYGAMMPLPLKFKRQYENFALIPQGLVIPKNNNVTLCGDAAGLTKPWSGGGVIWGLKAADLLLQNFPNLLKYRQATRRFFLPQIVLSKIATKIIYFLGFHLPWFLPRKIKMEGDYAFGNYHGRQPQMGERKKTTG